MYGPSKVRNQYYIGDLPGTLQYNVDPKKLIEIPVPDNDVVGHYRMAAPAIFWQELKNRLIFQETGLQLIKRLYSD